MTIFYNSFSYINNNKRFFNWDSRQQQQNNNIPMGYYLYLYTQHITTFHYESVCINKNQWLMNNKLFFY